MPRYAVRFYYDGRDYHGFQAQRAERTVASEILSALTRSKLVDDLEAARFQAASRTDRGASALAQTVAFTTEERFSTSRINAFLPLNITAWASAEVSAGFNPRREAEGRSYAYLYPHRGEDWKAMAAATRLLVGSHEFRNFTLDKEPCLRSLDKLTVERGDSFLLFSFSSRSFARGMIRKIVAALIEIGQGRRSIDELKRLLDPSYKPPKALPLAPAENLLLLDVKYGNIDFEVDAKSVERLYRELVYWATAGRLKELCLKRLAELRL